MGHGELYNAFTMYDLKKLSTIPIDNLLHGSPSPKSSPCQNSTRKQVICLYVNKTENFKGPWITLYCFPYKLRKNQYGNHFRLPLCLISKLTDFEGSISFIFCINMIANFHGLRITLHCFYYKLRKHQCSNYFRLPLHLISTLFEVSLPFIFHMNMIANFYRSWITLYYFHYESKKHQHNNHFWFPLCLFSTQFEVSLPSIFHMNMTANFYG